MNFRQSIPEYLISRRNTIIQIAFTAIFAYIFIIIYRPFGADEWYKINELQFQLFAGVLILTGMVVIILIRLLMLYLKKNHEIILSMFIWMIASEVILMSTFFTLFEKLLIKDSRNSILLFFNAVQNTSLILLIPYLMSSLFFAWADIKKKLDQVVHQFRDPSEVFVPFRDENGKVRLNLRLIDILYLESNDNYVTIFYNDGQKVKTELLRNTLKNLDRDFRYYPIYRCHRKYSVNIRNVKLFRKGKKNYEVVMNTHEVILLPVSKSYEQLIMKNIPVKIS